MKQTLFLIGFLTGLCSMLRGQDTAGTESSYRKNDYSSYIKPVNWGIKGGFNSSMYLVSDFKIKDVTIDEIQTNYKIGYFASAFMRLNLEKHFLQPEISYNVNKCEITFDKLGSQHPDIEPDYVSVNSTLHSIKVPVLYGYNFIKQGPYGMSFFLGPELKYYWNRKNKIHFSNFDQQDIREKLYPFNLSATVGVAVNISRIFFDFRYEQGLRNISKFVTYENITVEGEKEVSTILLRRRDNVLSFSLGVMF
ncbi:MAG: PorT family protein [Bacteroides sp.]|nr:PorT family protein [Bacteroides sp.]